MDPNSSNSNTNSNLDGFKSGDVSYAGGLDKFSLDTEDHINDSLSLHATNGLRGDIDERNDANIFSFGTREESAPSPSISQFKNMNLQASTSIGRGVEEDGGDIDVEDPFAALEAAIEEDKPK